MTIYEKILDLAITYLGATIFIIGLENGISNTLLTLTDLGIIR